MVSSSCLITDTILILLLFDSCDGCSAAAVAAQYNTPSSIRDNCSKPPAKRLSGGSFLSFF